MSWEEGNLELCRKCSVVTTGGDMHIYEREVHQHVDGNMALEGWVDEYTLFDNHLRVRSLLLFELYLIYF